MSGIYGFWEPFAEMGHYKKDINGLKLWNKAYGDREQELYVGQDVYLGAFGEMLSDMAKLSSPVLEKDEKYAVIDVVLYNRDELMEKGAFTELLSDEELLFSYIEKFGFDALKEVNGDFSGGIYDTHNRKLTLFRDHMGVRPLFYYVSEGSVAFSTDIRGLISMQQVDVTIDEKWLWGTVTGEGSMGLENTEFANIFCVKPASYISFILDNKTIKSSKESYWQLGRKKIRLSSETAYIEKLRELITDSVKRRLDAVSGLVGAELSGGLDSGVIDILIHRLGREGVYFSWSASPEDIPMAENDERLIIEDICRQENITCNYGERSVHWSEESVITKKMRQAGVEMDMKESPSMRYVFPPYVNTFQIYEASQFISKKGAKVVFTGHGGDEGVSHRCNPYELFYHREYFQYLKYMWDSTKGGKNRAYNTFLRCHKNLTSSRKILVQPFSSPFAVKDLLKKAFFEKHNGVKKAAFSFAYNPLAYIMSGGSRNRLDVVALLGAYAGVRYMVPYLDYRVIDFAVSIPRHMYLKNGKIRYIFREAFKDIMPESLYNLSRKEDNSWKNLKKEPKEEDDFSDRKRMLVDMLDRAYWDEYLDWEKLEEWVKQEKDSSEEIYDKGVSMCISNCVKIQNIISRARKIGSCEM